MELLSNNTQENEDLKEIGISIFGNNLNPSVITVDFLKLSGIIPKDWELGQTPILTPQAVQLVFSNNLTIMAQPGSVTFVDAVGKTEPQDLKATYAASMYVEKLPYGQYERVNIGAKIIIACPDSADAARRFIAETLMAMGPWQKIGKSPMQVGLNLFYNLETAQLSMNINDATLQQPGKPPMSAIIFTGAFTHYLIEQQPEARLNQLKYFVKHWRQDWDMFKDIVYNRFLISFDGQPETVFKSNDFL